MFVPIPGCPGCTVRVDFLHRYGFCEGREVKDLYVVGFDYKVGDCPCLSNKNDWERWDSVLVHFVKRFYWNDPDEDGIDSISLKYPPCAKTSRFFMNGSKFREGKYCYEDTACCIHVLRLRRVWENDNDTTSPRKPNFIIQDVVVMNYEGSCPVDTVVNGDTIRCTNICNQLVGPDPWPPGTPIYLSSKEFVPSQSSNGSFYITSKELKFPLNFQQGHQFLNISVYDYIGNLVYMENNLLSENGYAMLDLGFLPNGIYYILVKDYLNPFEKEVIKVIIIK